jgi:hypothetical protein
VLLSFRTPPVKMATGVGGCNYKITMEPYKSTKSKRRFIPLADHYNEAIICRSRASGFAVSKTPSPKNWDATRKIQWLKDNPIRNAKDILFLVNEVDEFVRLLELAELERKNDDELNRGTSDSWIRQEPHLRLYLVIMEDEITAAYLKVFDVFNRAKLDARNNSKRPKKFLGVGINYNPSTTAYPD